MKQINIAIFGKELVGSTLINQLKYNNEQILKRRGFDLNIFAITNSKKMLLNNEQSSNINNCKP